MCAERPIIHNFVGSAALFLFAGIAPDAAPLQSKISARSDNKILIGKEFEYEQ